MKDSQNFYVGVSKPRLSVLGCFEQYNLNETSNCVVFIFFQILRFKIRGPAYLWMWLIHGHLRYLPFKFNIERQNSPTTSPFEKIRIPDTE